MAQTTAKTLRAVGALAPAESEARPSTRIYWMVTTVLAAWHRRNDMNALQSMDDHLLKDIGLVRSQIEDAVRTGRVSRFRIDRF
jgi:uncharacterized protein YjiS (DUF1127 family)